MPTLAASVLVIAVLCASAVAQQASPPATAPADLTAEQDQRWQKIFNEWFEAK